MTALEDVRVVGDPERHLHHSRASGTAPDTLPPIIKNPENA